MGIGRLKKAQQRKRKLIILHFTRWPSNHDASAVVHSERIRNLSAIVPVLLLMLECWRIDKLVQVHLKLF